MEKNKLIFGFHISKSDIGYCVREKNKVLSLVSKLIPLDFANYNRLNSTNVRARQTLFSHRTRERWFLEYWTKILKLNAENIHESKDIPILLRLRLLKGEKLTDKQIFHAIWHLMQHRGYDRKLPWGRNRKTDIKRINEYESLAKSISAKYPCQVEAYNLGLWEYDEIINNKLYADIQRARGYTIPRECVVAEAQELLHQASLQYPVISEHIEIILFGQSKKPYSSYVDHDYKSLRGTDKELEGIFSQRVPRIDNRYITRCTIFADSHTCKNSQRIALEYSILKKLYKFEYNNHKLNTKEIRLIFKYLLKEKGWQERDYISMRRLKEALNIYAPHCIDSNLTKSILNISTDLKKSGRSIFCKKALYIIKALLLLPEYIDFAKIHKAKIADKTNTTEEDVERVLKRIYYNHEGIFKLRKRDLLDEINLEYNQADRNDIINKILNLINDYVIKNRIQIYLSELSKLKNKYREPQSILIDLAGSEEKQNIQEGKLLSLFQTFDSAEVKQLNIFDVIDDINNNTEDDEENQELKISNIYCFTRIDYIQRVLRLITAILYGWSKESINKKLYFSTNNEVAQLREQHQLNEILMPTSEQILYEELKQIDPDKRLNNTKKEISRIKNKTRESRKKSALDAFTVSLLSFESVEIELLLRSFSYNIKNILPEKIRPNIRKLQLENTIYGYKTKYNEFFNKEEHYIVKKINLQKKQKSKLVIRCDEKYIEGKIWDEIIREDWLQAIRTGKVNSKTWETYLKKYRHPVWDCPVRRVLIIESKVKDEPYYTHDNRMIVGQYINVSRNPQRHKNIQLKRSTEYQGHLIHLDTKGKAVARPIFVFESLELVKQKLRARKIELYSDELFQTGCFLEIKKQIPLKNKGEFAEPGIYILQTIRNGKQVTLEAQDGRSVSISLDKLVQAELEKVKYKEE